MPIALCRKSLRMMVIIIGWWMEHLIATCGETERIAFAIVPVEVRYPNRIVGMALLLWSMQ